MKKRILVGITGGIAAYKSAEFVRMLVKSGAQVRVILTQAAQSFVTPMTLEVLSGHSVYTESTAPSSNMAHIELAQWADVFIIAPISADTMACCASGRAKDLLTAVFLVNEGPVLLAPAMNRAMWHHQSTVSNIKKLKQIPQVQMIGPEEGIQACGDYGLGRMSPITEIMDALEALFQSDILSGLRCVVTAGPTRAPIDPVRFISNYSSGKMGFAVAEAAQSAGAEVTLVAGPVQLDTPDRVQRVNVETTQEMISASLSAAKTADIFISAAAVNDYELDTVLSTKLKRAETIQFNCVRSPDVLQQVAQSSPHLFCVGFSAEVAHHIQRAQEKRLKKGIDFIVANDISRDDIGFESDHNQAFFITDKNCYRVPKMTKQQMASYLIQAIAFRLREDSVREEEMFYKKIGSTDRE